MRRLHTYTYKQRNFLILLPLLLLAISTWSLSPLITPNLDNALRNVLLLSARIFFPGLFVIAVAFVVPTFDRCFQISAVSIVYVISVMMIPSHSIDILINPIICVLTAVSSLLAMLPYQPSPEENFIKHTRRIFVTLFFVIVLPVSTLLSVVLILRQMDMFILYTFDETFGRSFLSVIYVPLYLLLQTLGFHDFVGELITLRYQNNMVTAFVNTVIVTNLFSLPATIFIRSFFTRTHVQLFLTLLVAISILTNSIGSCVSLTLLLLLIFYPGAFCTLLISSMACFILSYLMQVPAITTVDNLYLPDVNLAQTSMSLESNTSSAAMLEIFAIFIPVGLVLLSMFISRERILDRRRKLRSINIGYTITNTTVPELTVLALLRALGGISNISEVEEDGSWLYIQVVSHDPVSLSTIKSMTQDKVLVDRINNIYLCNIGEQSHFLHQRLSRLIENPFGEAEYEVQLSTPFEIKPMPYSNIADNGTSAQGTAVQAATGNSDSNPPSAVSDNVTRSRPFTV